ncbi:MAG: M13 family metallopeptidase [Halioglobus sp.]
MTFRSTYRITGMFGIALLLVACAGDSAKEPSGDALVSGVYLDHRDTSVRPQDDFFHYVNGGWLATHEIPADKSRDGSFERLREAADADVRTIIDEAADSADQSGTAAGRIASLYNSFMDEEQVNQLGIGPLGPELEMIEGIASDEDLLAFFSYAGFAGIKAPLALGVEADFLEPLRHRVYVFQSGLGLPNSDYYIDDSDKGREVIAKYQQYMIDIYRRLGYDEPDALKASNNSWKLEQALASYNRPPEINRNYAEWHNLHGPGFEALPAAVQWSEWLTGYDLDADMVVSVAQPEYLVGFAEVFERTSLAHWRDYLKLRLVSSSAPYLDQELQDLSFDFYSRTLRGTPEMRPRWQRGVNLVNGSIGEDVGKIYVQDHFPDEAKARMDILVANLVEAYRDSINSLDWMGEDTRANALKKLDKFTPNIGYPVKWKDYSAMQLGDDLLANVRETNRWEMERDLGKLDEPVEKTEWSMNPQTVNAYYSALQNSINFPAAILQPPFFDIRADDAVNYGAIGAVIGHEIGHGFDDSGSQFDGDGSLNNWWTDDDRSAFKDRTVQLIDQYDSFEVLPGVNVNGAFTQGENIGDLAGASIAYKAYMTSLGGEPAAMIDGYTGEQRFFIGFAQAFLGKSRPERMRQMVKTDPHSPELFRVNGTLSNVDGFYEAFDVTPGDQLYRPTDERVKIW